MAEKGGSRQEKTLFFHTLPGILTGVAAIITALAGINFAISKPASEYEPNQQIAASLLQIASNLARASNFNAAIEVARNIPKTPQTLDIFEQAQGRIEGWEEQLDVQKKVTAHNELKDAFKLAEAGEFDKAIKVAENIQNAPQTFDIFEQAQVKIREWQDKIDKQQEAAARKKIAKC